MKNNMSNDDETYLWDKAGEPDPEIQELERVMGTLRYQPRQLVIPEGLKLDPQRSSIWNFGPRLAIAATIILVVGAAALWLSVGIRDAPGPTTAETKPDGVLNSDQAAVTVPSDVLNEVPSSVQTNPPGEVPGSVPAGTTDYLGIAEDARPLPGKRVNTFRHNRPNRTNAEDATRRRVTEPATPVLAADELREAQAGKAKLMLALRVASAKLNVALRKAQGTNSGNLIHNQHKIG